MSKWQDMASAPTGTWVVLDTEAGEQKAVWCNTTKMWWTEEDAIFFTTRVNGWRPQEERDDY